MNDFYRKLHTGLLAKVGRTKSAVPACFVEQNQANLFEEY